MPEDAVTRVRVAYCDVAVAEGLSGDDVFGEDLEIEEAGFVDVRFGHDATWWALVDDFCSWEVVRLDSGCE